MASDVPRRFCARNVKKRADSSVRIGIGELGLLALERLNWSLVFRCSETASSAATTTPTTATAATPSTAATTCAKIMEINKLMTIETHTGNAGNLDWVERILAQRRRLYYGQ